MTALNTATDRIVPGRPLALATTITREEFRFSIVPIALAGLVLLVLRLPLAAAALDRATGSSSQLLAAYGFVLVVSGPLISAAISYQLMGRLAPAGSIAAMETFSWIGRREWLAFREAIGGRDIPASAAAARRWLARYPDLATGTPGRVEVIALAGDPAAARAAAEALPADTPFARFTRANMLLWLAWLGGSWPPDLVAGARDTLRTIEDPEERLAAQTALAANEARQRLVEGRDWRDPLAALRPELGSRADGIRRHERMRLVLLHVVGGIVNVLVVGLLLDLVP